MANLMKFRASPEFATYNKHFKNITSISLKGEPSLSDDQLRNRARLAHVRAMEFAGKDLHQDSTAFWGFLSSEKQLALFQMSCKLLGREDLIQFFKATTPSLYDEPKNFTEWLESKD